ncbi:vigilin-like [Paramacrobiotus metropolitanus]|uniref:vigilin-like n=1 Tax=Paramacrobiotus metropolitanus TaxID=2943436 RepID=UPI0024459FB0|nr:vigilin-like [Paramacrobiotus metropolitanus]
MYNGDSAMQASGSGNGQPPQAQESGLNYSEAFPALPDKVPEGPKSVAPSPWGARSTSHSARMAMTQSSQTSERLTIPYEERRFKGGEEVRFGKDGESEKSVCYAISQDTGAQIVLTQSKDRSLTLLISGKREDVKRARNAALQRLQTQASDSLDIPKEYHRFILGAKGKTKEDLEVSTATKITVPRMDDANNFVKITGPKEGIVIAREKIMQIYEEQSKRAAERLNIPRIFHPFICGPNNAYLDRLRQKSGVSINVPPPSAMKDEISISGEREPVAFVKNELLRMTSELSNTTKEITVEVPRAQHRYVQGPRGNHLHEILEKTGVWVELPFQDTDSDSVHLRGNPANFGEALKMVFNKANSVVKVELKAPSWIHKYMIGKGGEKVRELGNRFPEVHVNFVVEEDKIVIEGPPRDVEEVRKILEAESKTLVSTLAVSEVKVDDKYMKHIIGKSGSNVSRLKDELGVQIRSSDANRPNVLVIEGPKNSVAEAVKALQERLSKMENERSKDIIIDRALHKLIIGQKGERIREIRDKFKETNVAFPESKENSDVVTIRGPKEEVDKCYKHLEKLVKDLAASNFRLEVPIFKDMHRTIIGKGGATIRKIRDETDTKIDLPAENADSDVITITGKKENAEKAKEMILKIQNELANAVEVKVSIPSKLHPNLIGAKGRTISGVIQECGNVQITLPQSGSGLDEITIRGPKADAEKAKQLLEKIAHDRELSSFTAEIPAKQEYHKYIVGANRGNINRLRERYNVRIAIPSSVQEEKDTIVVIGRKEDVEKAKVDIERTLQELHNTVDDSVDIPVKYHKNFTARRAEEIRHIQEETGNVSITFPRMGEENEKVLLRGPQEAVDAAKRMLLQRVADWESYITIEVDIPPQYYGNIMGPKGARVMDVSDEFDVHIKFPERKDNRANNNNNAAHVNGEQPAPAEGTNGEAPKEVITVTGRPEDCEAAKQALLDLVPVVEEMPVPFEYHSSIIGKAGASIRKLMDEFKVNINIPNSAEQSDVIKIRGLRRNVDEAKEGLAARVKELDKLKEERALRNFRVEMRVEPKYHFQLIGQRGVEVNKLRNEFQVELQFPRSDAAAEDADKIVIVGLESQAQAARDKIQAIIEAEKSKSRVEVPLDSRIHARIIGGKGAALKRLEDRFKVKINFPRRDDEDANVVTVVGDEENVYDCEAELKRLEDIYLDDVVENETLRAYHSPATAAGRQDARQNHNGAATAAGQSGSGFVVKGAPWEQNLEEFPTLNRQSSDAGSGNSVPAASAAVSNSRWGAPR